MVPRPAVRPGPSGSHALGHPGTAGSHRRAEKGVWAQGLDLVQDLRGKEGSSGWSHQGSSWFDGLMLGLGWGSVTLAGSAERLSTGDKPLLCSKGLLYSSQGWIPMKKSSPWL